MKTDPGEEKMKSNTKAALATLSVVIMVSAIVWIGSVSPPWVVIAMLTSSFIGVNVMWLYITFLTAKEFFK